MNQKAVATCKAKYGNNYFSELGKKGAKAFYSRYYLIPVQLNRFAIMKKSDNSFVAYLGVK